MSAAPQPNLNRKPKHQQPEVVRDRKPPVSAEESGVKPEAARRPFEGKRFVAFEIWILHALREGCNSLAEQNLILYIAELANDREPGNPFGATGPLMTKDLASAIGCTTQNVNCSAAAWFGPQGLVERTEAPAAKKKGVIDSAPDSRAFSYRIRVEFARDWAKARKKAREAKETAKPAKAKREAKPKPFAIDKPVRVGPGNPFKLPAEAIPQIQGCTAIESKRDGELRAFQIDGDVLRFDFAEASPAEAIDKSTCRSGQANTRSSTPQQDPSIDKSTCRSGNIDTENKGLSCDSPAVIRESLRAELDRRYMRKVGVIDTAVFTKICDALGQIDAPVIKQFLILCEAEKAKLRSWPFLIGIAKKARTAVDRAAELGFAATGNESSTEGAGETSGDYWERRARREKERPN